MQKLNALEMRKDICANGGARDEAKKKKHLSEDHVNKFYLMYFSK